MKLPPLALFERVWKEFGEDDCPRMAASMSYFTIFSLAPLTVLVLMIVGVFVDPTDVQGRIQAQMAALIGPDGARLIEQIVGTASFIFGTRHFNEVHEAHTLRR